MRHMNRKQIEARTRRRWTPPWRAWRSSACSIRVSTRAFVRIERW